MITNTNPTTGIRYGVINAHSIDPDLLDEIFQTGIDPHYEQYSEDMLAEARREVEEEIADGILVEDPDFDVEDEIAYRHERRMELDYCDDEPVREFDIDGVKGATSWLGGGQLLWVFESPVVTKARLCSPCCPNAGDLNNLDENGYECYGVPKEWLYEST